MHEPKINQFKNYSKFYRRDSTTRDYCFKIKKFFILSKLELRQVNEKSLRRYCEEFGKSNNYLYMIGRLRSALKQYYIFLNKECDAKLDLDIFDFKIKQPDFTPQSVITYKDTLSLIEQSKKRANTFAKKRNLMLLYLYSTTGMRRSEIVHVRMCDINLEKKYLTLYKTKTNNPRVIYLSEKAIDLVKIYIEERDKRAKNTDKFIIGFHGKALSSAGIESVVKSCRNDFGFKFSFHAFRRGFASDLFSSGADVTSISKALGHENISTTLKYYIYFIDEHVRAEVSKHPAFKSVEIS